MLPLYYAVTLMGEARMATALERFCPKLNNECEPFKKVLMIETSPKRMFLTENISKNEEFNVIPSVRKVIILWVCQRVNKSSTVITLLKTVLRTFSWKVKPQLRLSEFVKTVKILQTEPID